MKEMPTAILLADSEYIYVPDSDNWIIQKKSGSKILSKRDIEKVPPMEDPFAPYQDVEQRGPKEISEYDPEYQYLINLVNAVVKSGVPVREIKTLSEAFPFDTVDDVSDLIGHIWNLAREKYHIPQEAIMKNLSKNKVRSSLNKNSYEDGWPTEEDATYWGTAPVNTYSDEPLINHDAPIGIRERDDGKPISICPTCESQNINTKANPAKCLDCGTDFMPKPDRGSDDPTSNDYSQNYFWGPNDLGRSHQNQPGANGWLPAGTEDMDGPSPNVRMSSFIGFMRKQSSLNKVARLKGKYWIDPNGKAFDVHGNHGLWIVNNLDILNKEYGMQGKDRTDIYLVWDRMLKSGWTRISDEPAGTGFVISVQDIHNIPSYIDNFISENFSEGDVIKVGNGIGPDQGQFVEITDPFPPIQKAVNKELMHSKQASLLDEVLDQPTQDAIAAEYGPQMLIAIRFYNDAVRYGQSPDRAMAYALEEARRMNKQINQKDFLEVLNTYF